MCLPCACCGTSCMACCADACECCEGYPWLHWLVKAKSCLVPSNEQVKYTPQQQRQHDKLALPQDQKCFLALLCAELPGGCCVAANGTSKLQHPCRVQGQACTSVPIQGYMWHVLCLWLWRKALLCSQVLHRTVFSSVALQACCVRFQVVHGCHLLAQATLSQ